MVIQKSVNNDKNSPSTYRKYVASNLTSYAFRVSEKIEMEEKKSEIIIAIWN